MVRQRGLETREEGAAPTEGGMTLYLKAGPDGTSVGDCPFAQYVRMVLSEKGLPYDVRPCTADTKPQWLVDYYEGSMPALRHRKECYTDSNVIAQYLDFFFRDPPLSGKKKTIAEATESLDGFFPALAGYLKHTPDGDEEDGELKMKLVSALQRIEDHLARDGRTGPYLVGDGEVFTLLDCSLTPKLYHMKVALREFKSGVESAINLDDDFPALRKYTEEVFRRPSFEESLYPEDTIIWGWSNARGR